ncbi:TIGR03620 family F420-dependent LLM class oxidoreductase [Micromonospora profundi]|uniref:TIGR03620 family F420-dependent LLM class oxidoreductase n=1 Tax=Micromonospora profundi TaxID=1420889 RepID=A0AAJ6HR53_9ACTN|nr:MULTISPECIES: TIGR03620 family F420-dependent LLM class oxidoreductase [Micromonospora]KOX03234.1 F420-dependent oxidoreductase [Micromonospora sp. NRRL B-16802]NJC12873.1 putative F420-dependent oxidoreductase [Micromonospora profundi]WLS44717.1 TIGR03620 family F420-dependent LLM class oxidoreductase [Micromonospora profundi]
MAQRLVSVWQPFFLGSASRGAAIDAATELEDLGYSRLWFSGGFGENVAPRFREILDGTRRIGVASGIVSIWHSSPSEAAAFAQDAERAHPGRFLLGLGASHAVVVEGSGTTYRKPYSRMVEYLDGLDAAGLPPERRILAALGPRMLELSRDRSAGAHPYFVPAQHTAEARAAIGPDRLLAPEVAVVLDADAAAARATARQYTSGYLALPNYTNNLRRFGWTDEDFAAGGSDRLVDALIPWGTAEEVAAGLDKHYQAGADEVAVQVLNGGDATTFPADAFRALAAVLI